MYRHWFVISGYNTVVIDISNIFKILIEGRKQIKVGKCIAIYAGKRNVTWITKSLDARPIQPTNSRENGQITEAMRSGRKAIKSGDLISSWGVLGWCFFLLFFKGYIICLQLLGTRRTDYKTSFPLVQLFLLFLLMNSGADFKGMIQNIVFIRLYIIFQLSHILTIWGWISQLDRPDKVRIKNF